VNALGVISTAFVGAVVGLLVVESYQTTPWLADKLMRWSVRLRYADNPERGKVRGEELTSLLEDLPTLFKFPTACGFLLRALAYRLKGGRETPRDQLLKDQLLKVRVRLHWACLLPMLLQTFVVVVVALVMLEGRVMLTLVHEPNAAEAEYAQLSGAHPLAHPYRNWAMLPEGLETV